MSHAAAQEENRTESPAHRRRFRFNQKAVDALPPHDAASPSTEMEYSDEELRGLRLLVSKNGRKTYFLRYTFEGRKRAYRIGEHGPLSVQTARQEANKLKAMVATGTDPQAERLLRRGTMTFEEFANEHYLPHSRAHNRSWEHNAARLRNELLPRWGKKRIDEVTTLDVQRLMNEMRSGRKPATANRIFAVAHRMFRLAVLWGFIERNPANGVPKFKENNQRERYLAGEELQRFLAAMEGDRCPMAMQMLRFLLVTGARRGEATAWARAPRKRREAHETRLARNGRPERPAEEPRESSPHWKCSSFDEAYLVERQRSRRDRSNDRGDWGQPRNS